MFVRMACTITNMALATASEILVWASMMWSSRALLAVWSWKVVETDYGKVHVRRGHWVLATPSIHL